MSFILNKLSYFLQVVYTTIIQNENTTRGLGMGLWVGAIHKCKFIIEHLVWRCKLTTSLRRNWTNFSLVMDLSMMSFATMPSNVRIGRIESNDLTRNISSEHTCCPFLTNLSSSQVCAHPSQPHHQTSTYQDFSWCPQCCSSMHVLRHFFLVKWCKLAYLSFHN
jgi:hypothetical protein